MRHFCPIVEPGGRVPPRGGTGSLQCLCRTPPSTISGRYRPALRSQEAWSRAPCPLKLNRYHIIIRSSCLRPEKLSSQNFDNKASRTSMVLRHAIWQLLSVIFPGDGHSAIFDGVGVFRIELEHPVEVLNSPIVLAVAYVGEAAIVQGIGIVRTKRDRRVEVLHGAVNLADLVVSTATIIEGNGLVRIKLDRLVVVLHGAIILALSEVGVAAIADGCAVVRIDLYRLVVVLNGAVGFAPHAICNAALVEGGGVIRIEFNCSIIVLDGAVKVARDSVGGAAAVVGRCIVGLEFYRLVEVRDRPCSVADRLVGDAPANCRVLNYRAGWLSPDRSRAATGRNSARYDTRCRARSGPERVSASARAPGCNRRLPWSYCRRRERRRRGTCRMPRGRGYLSLAPR